MAGPTPEISIDTYAAQRAAGTTADMRERMEFAHGHVPATTAAPTRARSAMGRARS